jgi:phosphocarrier protein HPr
MSSAHHPEATVTIRNLKGLHARASAKFVKCAEVYDAEVFVVRDGQTVGGTSIMGLMMLAAGPGSQLLIRAQGADAAAALSALVALVQDGFGEECVDDK